MVDRQLTDACGWKVLIVNGNISVKKPTFQQH